MISAELKSAVGPELFDLWLAPLKLASLDQHRLVIEAPTASRAWVDDRFGQILKASAAHVLGGPVEVQVRAVGDDPVTARSGNSYGLEGESRNGLNPKYCFEQFVIGNDNRLAHGAALAVAENPGTAYNPLFICGPPGVGKTHLLHSIADYALRHGNGVRVRLTGAEAFANEFIAALRGGDINRFKARHRDADLVLVDDVQFLMAKAKTEEEFFHTFNALHQSGAQIVLTSDRPPRDLDLLEDRLRDRFDSGLVAEISAPDIATRLAVLKARAKLDQITITDEAVLPLVAARVQRNLRALEGALIRVVAYASLSGREITSELAEEVLDGLFPQRPSTRRSEGLSTASIQRSVSLYYNVSVEQLCSPSRVASVSWPRQVAMYLSREHTSESLPTIAAAFGGRSHTTALHAHRRVTAQIAGDAERADQLRQVTDSLFTDSDPVSNDRAS